MLRVQQLRNSLSANRTFTTAPCKPLFNQQQRLGILCAALPSIIRLIKQVIVLKDKYFRHELCNDQGYVC
ncbi:hypothetical protein ALP06_101654 [Pseudomonas coronafaciens pv. atropurpurea]|nr:hypothetical protein ALP06_101654 [Pseudomonas coronafaciens pv. atropurpurea]